MNKTQIILIGVLAVLVIIAVLMLMGVIPGLKPSVNQTKANLVIWGTEDPVSVWSQIQQVYANDNPNIKISYVQKNSTNYETDLVNALAAGRGPDIFAMDYSWVVKHGDKVYPLPQSAVGFSVGDFQSTFADATLGYIQNGQIISLPTSVDTLALYYNKDILNSENIPNPPSNWDDIVTTARQTRKISLTGDIIQGGIALGSAQNIEHMVDIVSTLFLQNGISIIDLINKKSDLMGVSAKNALEFYRSFSDPVKQNYAWSDSMPNSLDAFADGKVAMMIGFAKDYERIKGKNPRLNFGIAPLPQQKGSTIKINYSSPTGFAISKYSQNPLEAWKFLTFLTTDQNALKFYISSTNRPPAYRQYVTAGFLAPYLSVFQAQVLSAKSWLQPDPTSVTKIFQTMVRGSRGNVSSIDQLLNTAKQQLEDLLK